MTRQTKPLTRYTCALADDTLLTVTLRGDNVLAVIRDAGGCLQGFACFPARGQTIDQIAADVVALDKETVKL